MKNAHYMPRPLRNNPILKSVVVFLVLFCALLFISLVNLALNSRLTENVVVRISTTMPISSPAPFTVIRETPRGKFYDIRRGPGEQWTANDEYIKNIYIIAAPVSVHNIENIQVTVGNTTKNFDKVQVTRRINHDIPDKRYGQDHGCSIALGAADLSRTVLQKYSGIINMRNMGWPLICSFILSIVFLAIGKAMSTDILNGTRRMHALFYCGLGVLIVATIWLSIAPENFPNSHTLLLLQEKMQVFAPDHALSTWAYIKNSDLLIVHAQKFIADMFNLPHTKLYYLELYHLCFRLFFLFILYLWLMLCKKKNDQLFGLHYLLLVCGFFFFAQYISYSYNILCLGNVANHLGASTQALFFLILYLWLKEQRYTMYIAILILSLFHPSQALLAVIPVCCFDLFSCFNRKQKCIIPLIKQLVPIALALTPLIITIPTPINAQKTVLDLSGYYEYLRFFNPFHIFPWLTRSLFSFIGVTCGLVYFLKQPSTLKHIAREHVHKIRFTVYLVTAICIINYVLVEHCKVLYLGGAFLLSRIFIINVFLYIYLFVLHIVSELSRSGFSGRSRYVSFTYFSFLLGTAMSGQLFLFCNIWLLFKEKIQASIQYLLSRMTGEKRTDSEWAWAILGISVIFMYSIWGGLDLVKLIILIMFTLCIFPVSSARKTSALKKNILFMMLLLSLTSILIETVDRSHKQYNVMKSLSGIHTYIINSTEKDAIILPPYMMPFLSTAYFQRNVILDSPILETGANYYKELYPAARKDLRLVYDIDINDIIFARNDRSIKNKAELQAEIEKRHNSLKNDTLRNIQKQYPKFKYYILENKTGLNKEELNTRYPLCTPVYSDKEYIILKL